MKNACVITIAALLIAMPLILWSQDAPDGAELFKARCGTCHKTLRLLLRYSPGTRSGRLL